MAQLCSWYKEIDLLHVVSDRAHLGCWNIWQKHLLLGELCSLSVGLKVLFKGNSNQWVVDVMQKVFCRNPRHNGFGLLKSFILFYRWRSLAGSWAKNQTQVSGDISEAFFCAWTVWLSLNLASEQPRVSSLSHGHLCWLMWVQAAPNHTVKYCRAQEVQFPIPYRKLSPSFGEGSLGLLLGLTHSFLLCPASLILVFQLSWLSL